MNNIDELIERAQNLFGDAIYLSGPQQEVVEEMAAALRAQQERIAVLCELEANAERMLDKKQERIVGLERQLDAALEALEQLAKSPTPAGKYWKDFASDALQRIRGMK